MSHRSIFGFLTLLLLMAIAIGCGPSTKELSGIEYAPAERSDWKVATPVEHDLDPMLVADLYYNASKRPKIRSVLVIKDGHLVAERYFNDGSIDQKARLQSVTKSFTSALVGIALKQGYLESVDQRILEFYPEVADKITDPRKKEITIRQLLEMRSGFPREESDEGLWAGLLSGHYPPLIEGFPLTAEPGTRFQYSNLSSNWLGIIVDRSSGKDRMTFATENLFEPLGIEPGEWGQDADGNYNGCGDLHLTARDAAKFGLLYLNDGKWNGEQIVPAEWVEDSLKTYSVNEAFVKSVGEFRDIGYGYQWWSANVGGRPVNFAWGHGGQLVVLVEDQQMVVVVTSYPFWLDHDGESWKHEKANIKMVGEFVASLP
ncbi:beta-lactamase family protein [bacterium]|nr:beta-lactamase family protein [bacterium]